MLTYNMDVTPESVWKRTTPGEAELAQPYHCTEAGLFYAQQRFSTARTDKDSYILFYTLCVAGLREQHGHQVILETGQALLLTAAQRRATAPHQDKAAGITSGCLWMVSALRPWSRCFCRTKN